MRLLWTSARILGALYLGFSCVFFQGNANGAHFGLELTTGLMQQPTSQYYLWTYGANATLASENQGLILRLSYLERPKFKSEGFQDQDSALFAFIGGKSREFTKSLYVLVYAGFGETSGYIESTDNKEVYQKRSYKLSGPSFSLQIVYEASQRLRFTLSHETLVGISGQDDFDSYVVWPYLFYQFGIGYNL